MRCIDHTLRKSTSNITWKSLDWNPQDARHKGCTQSRVNSKKYQKTVYGSIFSWTPYAPCWSSGPIIYYRRKSHSCCCKFQKSNHKTKGQVQKTSNFTCKRVSPHPCKMAITDHSRFWMIGFHWPNFAARRVLGLIIITTNLHWWKF